MLSILGQKRIALGIATAGFTAIVTQTVLLREFLSVFYGNELIIGIVLAVWMILTGCGALLGKVAARAFSKIRVALVVLLFTSLLPLVTVFLLDVLRNVVFPVGTQIGVVDSLYSSFVLLAPFCLLSGALFTLFAAILSEQSMSNRIPDAYAMEAIGSVAGGLVFNCLLIFVFTTFQTLFLMALLDLAVCLYLSMQFAWRKYQLIVVLMYVLLLVLNTRLDLDGIAKRRLFPNQELLFHRDTPYGNLVVTQSDHQMNFYENGSILFVTGDAVSNEDAVHYAMVQHRNPQNVLLIGGGISGTPTEILKYGIAHVDYVELNPAILDLGKEFTSALDDPRIHSIGEDGRRFVHNAGKQYDVALINVPDPSTAQINRYFTVEFFRRLKERLNPNAVVGTNLLESSDYMNEEARRVSSVVFKTLKSQFNNVLIIPGLRNHYLASDGPLTTDIAEAIARRRISTVSVNRYYIDDQLLRHRSAGIAGSLDTNAVVNEDFTPVAYFRQIQYWLTYFGTKPWVPAVVLAILFIAVVGSLDAVSLGMFAGGFAASSIEVILLIAFQIIYGYVYQATGLIITVFMAGLALGAYLGKRRRKAVSLNDYAIIQIALAVYSLILLPCLYGLKDAMLSDAIVYGVFFFLTLIVAVLVGTEFSIATRLLRSGIASTASTLYGVDLIGSALGAFVISAFVLPLFGVTWSSSIVALMCIATAVVALKAGKRSPVFPEGSVFHV